MNERMRQLNMVSNTSMDVLQVDLGVEESIEQSSCEQTTMEQSSTQQQEGVGEQTLGDTLTDSASDVTVGGS